jgi:signal transduction histidine kinase
MADKSDDLEKWRAVQCKLNRLFVHDLKNPISAMSANLNFLEASRIEDTEDTREAIADSILAAQMLLKLADNFDMIALLESGETCQMTHVNMADFIRAAVRRNEGLATSAGIKLTIEEPLLNTAQYWQNRYAELVMDNLLMSAVRHSPHKGDVIVSLTASNGEISISVRDQGMPVAEEYIAGLFTRESQVKAKKSPGCRYGRGLGLYAVGMAIDVLGARIDIRERDGMAEFVFVSPRGSSTVDE